MEKSPSILRGVIYDGSGACGYMRGQQRVRLAWTAYVRNLAKVDRPNPFDVRQQINYRLNQESDTASEDQAY